VILPEEWFSQFGILSRIEEPYESYGAVYSFDLETSNYVFNGSGDTKEEALEELYDDLRNEAWSWCK